MMSLTAEGPCKGCVAMLPQGHCQQSKMMGCGNS
jgi:hypothetical protein